MKRFTTNASIALTLGLGLALALLWVLGGRSAPTLAAPRAEPALDLALNEVEGVRPEHNRGVAEGPIAAPSASAAELHVCPSGCPYSSIQDAVDAANDGDVIKVATGVYTGVQGRPAPPGYLNPPASGIITQVVYISKSVTIQGSYTSSDWDTSNPEANPTTLDAQGQGRVLYITGDISPTIEGLRITGGNAAGLGGDPRGDDAGGGVCVFTATAAIRDNLVFNNTAYFGGGLYLHSSTSMFGGNIVSSNIADHGGGLYLLWSDAMLSGNIVSSNTGGGLSLAGSDATLSGNTVSSNTGGGLSLAGSDATLSGNTVSSNTGRGLNLAGSDATLSGNIVSSNTDGGLTLYRSDATFMNNIVADNHADTAGNGLYIVCSSPRLLHTTIARNGSGDDSEVYVTNAGFDCSSVVIMTNTILVRHMVGITIAAGNTATLEGTLWGSGAWANGDAWGGDGTVITGTVNVWGDPAFLDPDAGDYHITPDSTAVDAGVDAGVPYDIDGDPRTDGDPDIGADELRTAALIVTKQAYADPVQPGAQLTYTIRVTNTGKVDLHATITDTLPTHITPGEMPSGTAIVPGGQITWTPTIPAPGGVWTETVVVIVETGYAGPLTNVVQVTTEEGAAGEDSVTVNAIYYKVYLPLVLRNH